MSSSPPPPPSHESQGSDTENYLLRLVEALFWRESKLPSLSDVDADVGLGCSYPCEQEDLKRLQPIYVTTIKPFPQPCSFQEAFDKLCDRLYKDKDAVKRFEDHFSHINDDVKQTWDLPAKMFNDLDLMIFHGQLRGRFVLRWEATTIADPGLLGNTLKIPSEGPSRPGHVRIALRYTMDWSCYPRPLMIGVLVHEMLHAYFIIMCGTGTEESTLRDTAHGDYWMSAAVVIGQKTKLDLSALRIATAFGHSDAWRTQNTCWFVLDFLGIENRDLITTRSAQLVLSQRYVQPREGIYMPSGLVCEDFNV
ncbi:hypothetical protein B0A48_05944 [Cryoendolithus antarcticus]|uniref:Uncharacterized protein n=1 Tax=Cryoendolithus antarcticus TaxID=1507870 RepID=A0A1V8TCE9_9PEZI|nr:hypothetical protein B0A48_05944 [Cryoendolithus antarcticus]